MNTVFGIMSIILILVVMGCGVSELYHCYVRDHDVHVRARNEAQRTLHTMRMSDHGVVGTHDAMYDALVALCVDEDTHVCVGVCSYMRGTYMHEV